MNPPHHPGQPAARAHPETASLLAGLNPAQREAVTHTDGPMLVLAGAGSGKTRVITHRIVHLIRGCAIPAGRILAVTFTNKAAAEMRERVEALVGSDTPLGWIGTFHALCLRLLRREAELVGLDRNFVIYDSDDQRALMKRLLANEDGEDLGTPRSFLSRISRAKNALETPDQIERRSFAPQSKLLARLYRGYNAALTQANAVDFDDLLLKALDLFESHPEAAKAYSSRCEYLLVDEYQDTNRPQYRLIRHLAAVHGNICVVGDEDQSIYRFRGAEIRNIMDFERDHPGSRVIRLEQNYRSSASIIQAAGALIANNVHRKGKTLWTENAPGEPIELFRAPDDRMEASWVSERVRALSAEYDHAGIAVLYRTNAQSRLLEEIFRRDRIPYQVVGSLQFYERKEIKDLLAYLKLAANPADDVAFRRVVNTPTRGIGNTTLQTVERVAETMKMPWLQAAGHAASEQLVASRSAANLRRFVELVGGLAEHASRDGVAGLLEHLVQALDFEAWLERSFQDQAAARMENVRSLISAAVEYAEESEEDTLQGFLDRSALVADTDDVGARPGVTLMTIHCAKGLEYPVVFVVGLEENLFPHAMSRDSEEDIEEERRLCYVALTRAKQRLLLSQAGFRRFQGALLPSRPSRFLDELPDELIRETAAPCTGGFWDDYRSREPRRADRGSSAARAAARSTSSRRKPVARGVDPGDGFAVGVIVRHPSFGDGQIVQREGSGKHLKLTINFNNHGQKKILPAYTDLQVEAPTGGG